MGWARSRDQVPSQDWRPSLNSSSNDTHSPADAHAPAAAPIPSIGVRPPGFTGSAPMTGPCRPGCAPGPVWWIVRAVTP
jgi:hypothetical protein